MITEQDLKEITCRLKRGHDFKGTTYNAAEGSPHWRKCFYCDYRELDHNDGIGIPDWQPTNYGTPAWDKI